MSMMQICLSEAMRLTNGRLSTWASSDTLCDGKQLRCVPLETRISGGAAQNS